MTATLGYYNPVFYANEALIWLRKNLGMAGRVHRGYDAERRAFDRGEFVNIKRPGTFVVNDAPSTAQDVVTDSVQVQLAYWREVKFKLTDKELAFSEKQIIENHIGPATYKLIDDIDQKLAGLVVNVPHSFCEPAAASASTVAGILAVWKQMFNNNCPVRDEAMMHFMIGGQEYADLAALSAFSQWQGAGPAALGIPGQTNQLGRRYGFEFFANQNRTTAAYADITDFAGAGPTAAKGATSIAVTGLGTTESIKKGSILKFTSGTESGNQYATTTDVTLSGGGGTLIINPGLRVGCTSGDTFAINDLAALVQGAAGTGALDNVTNNLNVAFHRDWAAVVMARLPDYGQFANRLGMQVASVQDDDGLAIRSRIYAVPNSSEIHVALDVLYGVKELNPELACRYEVKNV
jgi:hypothetical protein